MSVHLQRGESISLTTLRVTPAPVTRIGAYSYRKVSP